MKHNEHITLVERRKKRHTEVSSLEHQKQLHNKYAVVFHHTWHAQGSLHRSEPIMFCYAAQTPHPSLLTHISRYYNIRFLAS